MNPKNGAEELRFDFSVIIAVYNVEPFLREAADSIVKQDIGFEHIQLILVDDGSDDGSGDICDEYAKKYPENIIAVHKKNGGVSSARNEGLKYANGRYINFLDSDDRLSLNCMSEVKKFFNKHKGKTDVAVIPMILFGEQTGEYLLNYKFKNGTRVINLFDEYDMIQLSTSSAFIASEAIRGKSFDTELKFTEDAKLLSQILLDKMTMGVLDSATYWYRKRNQGQKSASQSSTANRSWYIDSLCHFYDDIINYSKEKYGYVPQYIQYIVCYDIQWRVFMDKIPEGVISDIEYEEYKKHLYSLLCNFDDDVIMNQKNIYNEHKLFMLEKKYGRKPDVISDNNNVLLKYSDTASFSLAGNLFRFDMITAQENGYLLEGYISTFKIIDNIDIYAEINGENKLCEVSYLDKPERVLEEEIQTGIHFKILIPDGKESCTRIFYKFSEGTVYPDEIHFEKFFPLAGGINSAYCCENGKIITFKDGLLYICDCNKKDKKKREFKFCIELLKSKETANKKAALLRMLSGVIRLFLKKPVWIVSDRQDRADDNGETFFKYMRKEHADEISCYFTILGNAPDYDRLKKEDKHIIKGGSYKHKILFMLCDCNTSSQADDYVHTPFWGHDIAYRDIYRNIKQIFLQHGITQNDVSAWLNRFKQNLSGFVTAALPEYQSILDGKYFYTDKEVWLTGFPRFDRLYHDEKKIITIMPTWRSYLVTEIDIKTGVRKMRSGFCDSDYFKFYNALVNDSRLAEAAEKNGYHLALMPHPNMQGNTDLFSSNGKLQIFKSNTSYRDMYAVSDLIVTDYSSAVFDFAYLKKPIIYSQFDKDEFFSGLHTLTRGYFDYERDGFGEVKYDLDGTVECIIEYMENGCRLKDKYRERIDKFFRFTDADNSKRVYEKIKEICK